MKLAISNIISSIVSSDPARAAGLTFSGGGRTRSLTVVRRAGMKGMRLSVDPRDASVRLTLAPRVPLRPALAWVVERKGWIEAELGRLPPPCPIAPGMAFLLAGTEVRLDWSPDRLRRPALADGVLSIGGPLDQLPARLLRYLRAQGLALLTAETHEMAHHHGITVANVGVGDPRGRWGSCSNSGDIRYSWRLVLAPDFVRRAVVAHEIAHRRHMDHSPAFYAFAKQIGGIDQKVSRAWLKTNGISLHWFGRDS